MEPHPEDLTRRPLDSRVVLGVCLVIGTAATVQFWLHARIFDTPVDWPDALHRRMVPNLLAGALAFPIAALTMRVPFRGGSFRRAAPPILLHLLAAVLYMLLAESVLNFLWWAAGRGNPGWRGVLWSVTSFGTSQLVGYFSIVGVVHAVRYFREARRRERAEADLTVRLAEARLRALEAQLNPHFLFNTLNAVSVLALRGDQEAVTRTLSRLGDILRASLDARRRQLVPLREELALLDGYLEIQQVRFGERLAVTREIDPAALPGLVPTLLTQPLVENAVQHGIAPRPGPGRIEIRAARDGGRLSFSVRDTGAGFSGAAGPTEERIGLSNTRERLARLYGGDASLSCANVPDGGALVTVSVPFRAEADVA